MEITKIREEKKKKVKAEAVRKATKETEKKQNSGCHMGCGTMMAICAVLSIFGIEEINGIGSVIIVGIGLIVYLVTSKSNKKEVTLAVEEAVENVEEQYQNTEQQMEAVYAIAEREKFSITKEVTNINGDSCLMIDTNSKRWIIKTSEMDSPQIFNYKELISYELCCDDETVSLSSPGATMLGAIVGGATGAIIGASLFKRTLETCSEMYIRITDGDANVHKITLVDEEVDKSSEIYEQAMLLSEQMIAILDVININR